jgi:hypothetical protein
MHRVAVIALPVTFGDEIRATWGLQVVFILIEG